MAHADVVEAVIALVALLLVAAVAAIGLRRVALPYTVGLVLVGLGLGALADRWSALEVLRAVELSPDVILFVFLPTLIFEAAFNLDSRLLARNLTPVLVLAAPGLALSTALVGVLVAWLTPLPLGPALLFGALISATDPVAVIALFKELGAPKRLAILVEGESLFNDATAIVAFRIILAVVAGGVFAAGTIGAGVVEFAYVFLGGLLVGGLIGYVMIRSIALANDDPLVEVSLSTVVAYAAFIAADHYLRVSGVMATVGAGIVVGALGSTRFPPRVREYLHQFWEYAAFVANGLIFLLVGLSVAFEAFVGYLGPIAWTLVAVTAARAVTVFGLVPVVGRLPGSEPIDRRYQLVLFAGGLRGAVALALVLSLPAGFAQRDLMTVLTVAVVLFTLLAGGTTMRPLMRRLGLDRPTLADRLAHAQAAVAAKREALGRVTTLATAGHFSSRLVAQVEQEQRSALAATERDLAALRQTAGAEQFRQALWQQAIAVERAAYRRLFDHGAVSEPVLRELELEVDLELDAVKRGVPPSKLPAGSPLELKVMDGIIGVLARIGPRRSLVQRHQLRALTARYERNAAILEASRAVIDELPNLIELAGAAPAVGLECRTAFQQRALEALGHLDAVAEHFPEYVQAVQRQTTRRMALDAEADAVEHLAHVGAIPDAIAHEARRSAVAAQRELLSRPVAALKPQPSELLSRVPFFAALAPEDVERVAAALVPRTVLAGQEIIRQGDHGTSLFLIARGVVSVSVARPAEPPRRVASLHAGEFFGEMALLTAEPRTATVTAVTDCQLYELSKREVDAVSEHAPAVRHALVEAYTARRGA